MSDLNSIQADLERQRDVLQERQQAVQQQADDLAEEVARIDHALMALRGQSTLRPHKAAAPRRKRRASKPSATKAELVGHIRSVMEASPGTSGKDLETQVRSRVKESGRALSGFGVVFPKALAAAKQAS